MKTYCNNCLENRAKFSIFYGNNEVLCCGDCLAELRETADRIGENIVVSPLAALHMTIGDLFS